DSARECPLQVSSSAMGTNSKRCAEPEPRSSLLVTPIQTWPCASLPVAPQIANDPQKSGIANTRVVGGGAVGPGVITFRGNDPRIVRDTTNATRGAIMNCSLAG